MTRIAMCCNDPDTGLDTGRADCIEISGTDPALSLIDTDVVVRAYDRPNGSMLQVGRVHIPIRSYRVNGPGNWCWNEAGCADIDALRIVNYLMRKKHCHAEDGPDRIVDMFNARTQIDASTWRDRATEEAQ